VGTLRRPELQPGPLFDLYDALFALHRRASWPSMEQLRKLVNSNRNTVHHLFIKPETVRKQRGLLIAVVVAMTKLAGEKDIDGAIDKFEQLWQAVDAAAEVEEMTGRRQSAPVTVPPSVEQKQDPPLASTARRLAQAMVETWIEHRDLRDLLPLVDTDSEAEKLLTELRIEALADHDPLELLEWTDEYSYAAQLLAEHFAEEGDLEALKEQAEEGNRYASYQLQKWAWTDHPYSPEPSAPPDGRIADGFQIES
jgi:hypothetical protein